MGDAVSDSELQCSSWLFCSVKLESAEHICIKHTLFQKKKEALGFWKLSKECFIEREAFWFWHVSLMFFSDKVSFWAFISYFWISCHWGFKSCILSFSLKKEISATVGSAVKFYSSMIIKYQRRYFMAFQQCRWMDSDQRNIFGHRTHLTYALT